MVLLQLQKTSRTVSGLCDRLESQIRPLLQGPEASPDALLTMASSDYDETITLLLLAANNFGRHSFVGGCNFESTFSRAELDDLTMLRNLWEHKGEKLMNFNGTWSETRAKNTQWLDKNYGRNWISAFSITVTPTEVKIGEKVNLSSLRAEVANWTSLDSSIFT